MCHADSKGGGRCISASPSGRTPERAPTTTLSGGGGGDERHRLASRASGDSGDLSGEVSPGKMPCHVMSSRGAPRWDGDPIVWRDAASIAASPPYELGRPKQAQQARVPDATHCSYAWHYSLLLSMAPRTASILDTTQYNTSSLMTAEFALAGTRRHTCTASGCSAGGCRT